MWEFDGLCRSLRAELGKWILPLSRMRTIGKPTWPTCRRDSWLWARVKPREFHIVAVPTLADIQASVR